MQFLSADPALLRFGKPLHCLLLQSEWIRLVTPQDAWRIAYNQLELQFDRANFDTWIKNTTYMDYDSDKGEFVLGVSNSYALDMLRHRLYRSIRRVLSDVFAREIEIRFELIKHEPPPPLWDNHDEDEMPLFRYMAQQPPTSYDDAPPIDNGIGRPRWNDLPESELNPQFTFDRFIVNRANSMVYEAARAVAERPNGGYNPLMIYGGVGLGKTHLLQAIANACQNRSLNVIYVPSEAFTNDLVQAIRKRQQAMFREKYRNADVLIVDDVQFIAGKESTQEEFFHTFNALYTFNKQIVIASDRHPDKLTTLEDRLRSRFGGGLIVDVQPPEFETRVAIMEMWCQDREIYIQRDVLEMIADRAPDNIRELAGAFNQIVAKARFDQNDMNMDRAVRTLNRFEMPRNHRNPITIERVLNAVAEHFQVEPETVRGKRRTRRVADARQVAMYLIRELTDASLPQIGEALGGRAHSTVLHSCNKIADELQYDINLRTHIEAIKAVLVGA